MHVETLQRGTYLGLRRKCIARCAPKIRVVKSATRVFIRITAGREGTQTGADREGRPGAGQETRRGGGIRGTGAHTAVVTAAETETIVTVGTTEILGNDITAQITGEDVEADRGQYLESVETDNQIQKRLLSCARRGAFFVFPCVSLTTSQMLEVLYYYDESLFMTLPVSRSTLPIVCCYNILIRRRKGIVK